MNERHDDPRILLAQAIWLVDYFKTTEHYHDFIKLLPDDAPDSEMLTGIRYYDSRHWVKIIDSTVYLLANRHDALLEDFATVMSWIDEATVDCAISAFTQNITDITKKADKLHKDRIKLLTNLPVLLSIPETMVRTIVGKRAVKLIKSFGSGDPYELCAAHLFLEHTNQLSQFDDSLMEAMLVYAITLLPWSQPNQWFYGRIMASPDTPNYTPMKVSKIYTKKNDDGLPTEDNITMPEKMNFAQLVYSATGLVLPRDEGISSEFVKYLQSIGIPEITAHEVAAIAVAVGKEGMQQ